MIEESDFLHLLLDAANLVHASVVAVGPFLINSTVSLAHTIFVEIQDNPLHNLIVGLRVFDLADVCELFLTDHLDRFQVLDQIAKPKFGCSLCEAVIAHSSALHGSVFRIEAVVNGSFVIFNTNRELLQLSCEDHPFQSCSLDAPPRKNQTYVLFSILTENQTIAITLDAE